MWKCKQCREEIEEQFDACWKCGATKPSAGLVMDDIAKDPIGPPPQPAISSAAPGETVRSVFDPGPCPLEEVISHWHKLYEGLAASSLDYYTSLERALALRKIPGTKVGRIAFHEGGILSAKREYLRVTRGDLTFDVCAAPFGTGFFFSWWLSARGSSAALVYLVGLVLLALVVVFIPGVFAKAIAAFAGVVALAFLVPRIHKAATRLTYYKLDAALMFQDAVRGAVRETIDAATKPRGIAPLTDEEWKPIMRGFFEK